MAIYKGNYPIQFQGGGRLGINTLGTVYQGNNLVYGESVQPPFEFILDTQSAFLAVSSTRKLRSDYTGPAFRARNNSTFAELDIGFVNNLVDTASLQAFLGANDGGILTWYDQSENGADLTGVGLPTLKDINGYATLNGKQAVYVPAADLYFERTTDFTSNKVVEVMCVGSITGGGAQGLLWTANNLNGYSFGTYETGGSGVSVVASSGARLGEQAFALGTPYLWDVFFNVDGGVNQSFINQSGTQTDFTLTTGTFAATSFRQIQLFRAPFGAGFRQFGYMNEFIMFGDATANRTTLKNNINTFYGL